MPRLGSSTHRALCHIRKVATSPRSLLVLFTVALVGCQRPALIQYDEERPLSRLFEGFVFVGQRSLNDKNDLPMQTRPVPQFISPGYEYLFRHATLVDTGEMGQKVFPERLAALSFTVVSAPNSRGDGFIMLDGGGGPIYTVKAQRNTCELAIHHGPSRYLLDTPWPWVKDGWEPANYGLIIKGECPLLYTGRV